MKAEGENMKLSTKLIAQNAIIAGIYAVMTLAIAPLAYSEIQFRLSEVIVLLAFYNKKFIPGLVIGCFIANIPSPLGWMDMVFGTFSTLLVCITIYKMTNKYLAVFAASIITGVIVGLELHLAYGIPFIINAIYVALGELGVLIIGLLIFSYIENHPKIKELIK